MFIFLFNKLVITSPGCWTQSTCLYVNHSCLSWPHKICCIFIFLPGTLNNTLCSAGSSDDYHVSLSLTVTWTFETWTSFTSPRAVQNPPAPAVRIWGRDVLFVFPHQESFSVRGRSENQRNFHVNIRRVNIECREEGLPLSHAETYQYSSGLSKAGWDERLHNSALEVVCISI